MRLSIHHPPQREAPEFASQADEDVTQSFVRFNACNTVFARAQWDERIRSKKAIDYFKSMIGFPPYIKKTDGYTQKDFALRNAGWTVANLTIERNLHKNRHDGFLDDIEAYRPPYHEKIIVSSPEQMSQEIKKVAALFGADLCGIAKIDSRWHYTHRFDAVNCEEKEVSFPEGLTSCIVFAAAMPYDVIKTYPSALAGFGPGMSYSKETFIVQGVAQFIRNLGYTAIASLNDTANSIPYAIQAGLGEYARNGLVITKEFGPRVRFGMIFTDIPLSYDQPLRFGVKEFCNTCNICAVNCPAKAIPFGTPSDEVHNVSNITGVKKWTVDGEKCFKVWVNQGTECGICVRVCPYNLDGRFIKHRLFKRILLHNPFKKASLAMYALLKINKRLPPKLWWRE